MNTCLVMPTYEDAYGVQDIPTGINVTIYNPEGEYITTEHFEMNEGNKAIEFIIYACSLKPI